LEKWRSSSVLLLYSVAIIKNQVKLLKLINLVIFESVLAYAYDLEYEEKPDYAYIERIFNNILKDSGFSNKVVFDWNDSFIKK
jgi:hypothetical protein